MSPPSLLPPGTELALVVPGLGPGGAERVVTGLANWWSAVGHKVSVLTLAGPLPPPFYALSPAVDLVPLDLQSTTTSIGAAVAANLSRVARLRKAILGQHGCVISFIDVTNVLVLLATIGTGIPVVAAERTHPSTTPAGAVWRRLRKWTYSRAAVVVVQTEAARQDLERSVRCRTAVIPNPVWSSPLIGPSAPRVGTKWVIGVGRLTHAKGFDLLIRAFADVARARPDWGLRLVGDGPDRAELERLAGECGIHSRLEWTGVVQDPATWFRASDVFCLPSRYEGFPNVLCEAMAAGLPAVAADCPSGPREIVTDGVDGLLIPPEDVAALARALATLVDDPTRRQQLGARARAVADRFAPAFVLERWERTLIDSGCVRPA
jgi:glycosyltransferase involved in cell wall biosynthesis